VVENYVSINAHTIAVQSGNGPFEIGLIAKE
jgi:hypothetical protein